MGKAGVDTGKKKKRRKGRREGGATGLKRGNPHANVWRRWSRLEVRKADWASE